MELSNLKNEIIDDIYFSKIGIEAMAFSYGYGKVPEEQYRIEAKRL